MDADSPTKRSALANHWHLPLELERVPETASQHLTRRVPLTRRDETAAELLARLARHPCDAVETIFVLDGERLAGVVAMQSLLAAPPTRTLGELTEPCPAVAKPDDDQEEVAGLALRHHLAAVPVAAADGRFLGAVTASDLITVLRREHIEDLHRLAGIVREKELAIDALEAPPARRARHRLPWLLFGLGGAGVATWISARFSSVIEEHLAVAFFVPGIVYLADAIGTQTEAIAVRALSLGRLPLAHVFLGELRTGLFIGLCLALIAVAAAWPFAGAAIAIAVGISIVAAGLVAASVGLLLPYALDRMGADPAFGSGPVATVIQDILSLAIYFGVARAMLT